MTQHSTVHHGGNGTTDVFRAGGRYEVHPDVDQRGNMPKTRLAHAPPSLISTTNVSGESDSNVRAPAQPKRFSYGDNNKHLPNI